MDSKSPYLDAIQKIPGNTAKEKYESLNRIIHQIIESKKAPGDFAQQTLNGSLISEVLRPLIETEIGKILKKTDDVIAGLKSDDFTLVNHALQAEWIFNGSDTSITNFPFFSTYILPEVSVNTRTNIIKRLSQHLGHKKEYTLAQQFFEGFLETYGQKQALPLFIACSENYIAEVIKDGNVYLPKKIVTKLFQKYPELAIRYLKFTKPNTRDGRVVIEISISEYADLLPLLIKKHVSDFIDIVNSFEHALNIKLGSKCGEFFLKCKDAAEALIEFPCKYLPILSLKLVTRKLNKEQFELMFRNRFPKNQENFCFDEMLKYLEFQPLEQKLPLILKTYRDLYGIDLISILDKVTPQMMLMLPEEDRVSIAQKKLALDSDYDLHNCKESWICYLPTTDSIPRIKDQISNTKEMNDRLGLVRQLFYTCKVNNSNKDLIHVLQYVSTRHRNEISIFWIKVYETLLEYFDLALLDPEHWIVLNEMIQRSYIKDEINQRPTIYEKVLEQAIHYNLLHNIPIDNYMNMLAELKIESWNSKFNILCGYPKYEKQCLDAFIDIISRKCLGNDQISEDNRLDTIQHLLASIYDYNERLTKTLVQKQKKNEERLLLTNYPWLLETVKSIVLKEDIIRYQYKVENMKSLLRKNDRGLYDTWFPFQEKIARVFEQEGLNLLKKEPEKILEHWKEYLECCKNNIHYVHTKRFLRKCTWYAGIPVKFVEELLSKVEEGDSRTIMILAILLRGPEFAQIIKPMIPVSDKMEIDGEDAKKAYRGTSSVPAAFNELNPPPPLELVGRFCQGDYLSLALASLMNVARRVPVNKVITFAKSLVDKPISVRKHGIRLMCVVAPIADLCEFLRHLWESEKHKSIREVVFQKAHYLFTIQPSKNTWLLINFCIEGLTREDIDCFNTLKKISNVPNEYIKEYYETALTKIEKLEKEGFSQNITSQLICSFLKKADSKVCTFFPEDYCRLLLRKYAFDLSINSDILIVGRFYGVFTFLIEAKEKLESRLKYFCDLLFNAISKHWDEPHPMKLFYPMKHSFREIIGDIVRTEITIGIDPRILKALMNLFSSALEPVQDPDSFLQLFFAIEFRKAEFNGKVFAALIGRQLPNLVKVFTAEMMINIAETLSDFFIPLSITLSEEGTLIGSLTQALTEVNTIHSAILASILLYKNYTSISEQQYKDIVQKLQKVNHPAVKSFLNKHTSSLE